MIEIKIIGSGSKGNCYHITDGSTPLLLECGVPFKNVQKALNFDTKGIRGVLVTHEHKDHCMAINDVIKRGLNIYMSKGTREGIGINSHRIHEVENKKSFQIGTWTILPFDVQHDVNEPFGFLLTNRVGDKLLFATDTYYIKYKLRGLTHIMIECNYSEQILSENIEIGRIHEAMGRRVRRSHFSLENLKEFFKANDLSKVQQIVLLHLSDTNSNEELFKHEIQKLTGKVVIVA